MKTHDKYTNILNYFNVYLDKDFCPQTRSYVEMDDIHDAIIYNGVDLNNKTMHYIIKSKQMAMDRRNKAVRQYSIITSIRKRTRNFIDDNVGEIRLDYYGFTEIEKTLCKEKIKGIPASKSGIPRRQYEKILNSIKDKLLRHDMTASKIRTKL